MTRQSKTDNNYKSEYKSEYKSVCLFRQPPQHLQMHSVTMVERTDTVTQPLPLPTRLHKGFTARHCLAAQANSMRRQRLRPRLYQCYLKLFHKALLLLQSSVTTHWQRL
jgi:hypothetical protein